MRLAVTPIDRARRRFLGQLAALGALAPGATHRAFGQNAPAPCVAPPPGELVRTLPLYGPGAQDAPLGQLVGGAGLDARLFTDLSGLTRDRITTPPHEMFVRTAAPRGLTLDPAAWTVAIESADGRSVAVSASALVTEAGPMGTHLIECAGNSNPQHFGLMSAVEWHGVPLARVLSRVSRPPQATGIVVSGKDHEASDVGRSVPGASWILWLDDLERRGAFLATGMAGAPLTADHGGPIRLVVPGWYGCAWIKWVDEIRWVTDEAPSTSQMLEYAGRTHQDGRPMRARDYAPPLIDTAAMPIRVEQRRSNGRTEYDVVGIVWGGTTPVDRLVLRTGSRDLGVPVSVCPAPTTHHTWSLWTHRWRPSEPGYYDLSLRVADASVRTRRLDLSFYIRRVRIDDV